MAFKRSQEPHLAPASGERSPRFAAGEGLHLYFNTNNDSNQIATLSLIEGG